MPSTFNDGVQSYGGIDTTVLAQPSNILYCDAIDHLRYNYMGGDLDTELRDIKQAIQTAYREVAFDHSWRYYRAQARVKLQAPYSTGTISSSGATVTLTGGTWTATIVNRFATLLVDGICYRILSYNSASTLTLEETPITDFSSETYVIFRSRYTLPSDFRMMDSPMAESGGFCIRYVSPADWLASTRKYLSTGQSTRWTMLADPDFPGGMSIVVDPYPSAAATIDFIYVRQPRTLRRSGMETASFAGTIATSASAVTGTSTSFSDDMTGAFIRVGTSASSTLPTGLSGSAPYTNQRRITTYTSSTSLTVYPSFDYTYGSGTGYLISDPVDLWPGMITAFYRRAELELSIARNKDTEMAMNLYVRALNDARDRDSMNLEYMRAGSAPEIGMYDSYSVSFD